MPVALYPAYVDIIQKRCKSEWPCTCATLLLEMPFVRPVILVLTACSTLQGFEGAAAAEVAEAAASSPTLAG